VLKATCDAVTAKDVNKSGPLTTLANGPHEGWLTGLEPAIPRSTIKRVSNASTSTKEFATTDAQVCTSVGTSQCKNIIAEPVDADLKAVIAAWASLPAVIKAGILAMIRAAPGGAG